MYDEIDDRKKKQYESLEVKIKKQIDRLNEIYNKSYQFKVIKRTRPKLKKGDIFVFSVTKELYFVGVVYNYGFENTMGDTQAVVFIYKTTVSNIEYVNENIFDFSEDNILIGPILTPRHYWTDGLFYNIGNRVELLQNIDYGFYRAFSVGEYVDEYGTILSHKPKLINHFGIPTIIGVAYTLHRELIIDHSFLPENQKKIYEEYIEQVLYEYAYKDEVEESIDTSFFPFELFENGAGGYTMKLQAFSEINHFIKKIAPSLGGNGYDWGDVVKTYVREHYAGEEDKIELYSMYDAMYAYSKNEDLMESLTGELAELIKSGGIEEYIVRTKFNNQD